MTATRQLTLDDLVRGLEHFGARYQGLDVFVRDLQDVVQTALAARFGELHLVRGEVAFLFERSGRGYVLRFHPSGLARLTRASTEVPLLDYPLEVHVAAVALLGASAEATVFQHVLPSAVLGFLVGPTLGDTVDAPRRLFIMSHDPQIRDWEAYDGPLPELLREKRHKVEAALRPAG